MLLDSSELVSDILDIHHLNRKNVLQATAVSE